MRSPKYMISCICLLLLHAANFSQAESQPSTDPNFKRITKLAKDTLPITKRANDYQGQFKLDQDQAQILHNESKVEKNIEDLDRTSEANSGCTHCKTDRPPPEIQNQNATGCDKTTNGDPYKVFVSGRYSDMQSSDRNYSDRTFQNCASLSDPTARETCKKETDDRNTLLGAKSNSDLRSALTKIGEGKSFDEKVDFIAKLGNDFSNVYDSERENDNIKAKGGVSCLDLFKAVKSRGTAGVCRDMALCQTQMLSQMGVKGAYVVAFATPGGYHTTVLAENPQSPGDSRIINYNEVTSSNSPRDILVRTQPGSNTVQGIMIRAYGADGKPVTALPTLVGQFLNEATGGSGRDFNPFLRDNSQVLSTGIQVGDDPCNRFMLSAGKLQSGEKIYTLSYIRDIESDNSMHRFAAAIGARQAESRYEKITAADVYTKYEYVRKLIKADFDSGKIDIYFKTRIEGMLSSISSQLNDDTPADSLRAYSTALDLAKQITDPRNSNPMSKIKTVVDALDSQRSATQNGVVADANVTGELGARGKQKITSSTQLDYYVRGQVQPAAVQINTLGTDPRRYRGYVNLVEAGMNVKQELAKGIYLELLLQAAIQEPTTVIGYKASVGTDTTRVYYRGTQNGKGQAPSVLAPDSFRSDYFGIEQKSTTDNFYWFMEAGKTQFGGEGQEQTENRVNAGITLKH